MNRDEFELPDPKLKQAAEAVAHLSRPEPPADLVARTLARVAAGYQPIRSRTWILRPITHPLARVMAAAGIMLALFPMTDLEVADPLGSQIEHRIVGPSVVDRFQDFVDHLLVRSGPGSYSQADLDAFMGIPQPAMTPPHRGQNVRMHMHQRV